MLDLDASWVWDFWTAREDTAAGPLTHLFFLHAPRSLGDPDLRHRAARVGHAVSTDLVSWRRVADPLPPPRPGDHDDLATWTGSVVRDDDGLWWMFTSGLSRADHGLVQRVGAATSTDLLTWERVPGLRLEADERWYLRHPVPATPPAGTRAPEEHWRDPLVVRADDGTWLMLLTAQAAGTARHGHGVVGRATSTDLRHWEVGPPLSEPTGRFDQLEVLRLRRVDGRWALLFSCLAPEMPGAEPGAGGIWSMPVDGPGARLDPRQAVRLTDERCYVGDVVEGPDGPVLLAFAHVDADGEFVGGVIDPVPVGWRADGRGLECLVEPGAGRPARR